MPITHGSIETRYGSESGRPGQPGLAGFGHGLPDAAGQRLHVLPCLLRRQGDDDRARRHARQRGQGLPGHGRPAGPGPTPGPADRLPGPVLAARDLFQVVDDDRGVTVDYIGKGVANLEIYDESAVAKKYDIPGTSYAAFA